MSRMLTKADRALAILLQWIVIACMVTILLMLALNIAVRVFPVFSMAGFDEIIELMYVWMTFLGAVVLWREGSLFRVETLLANASPSVLKAMQTVILGLSLLFAVLFTYWGWVFASGSIEMTAFLEFSKKGWYMAMPVSGILMVAYSVAGLWRLLAPPQRV